MSRFKEYLESVKIDSALLVKEAERLMKEIDTIKDKDEKEDLIDELIYTKDQLLKAGINGDKSSTYSHLFKNIKSYEYDRRK